MKLVVDPSGFTYGGYDECLVFLGASPDKAIESLCSGETPVQPDYLKACDV